MKGGVKMIGVRRATASGRNNRSRTHMSSGASDRARAQLFEFREDWVVGGNGYTLLTQKKKVRFMMYLTLTASVVKILFLKLMLLIQNVSSE